MTERDVSKASRTFDWNWHGAAVSVGYDAQGNGSTVLLLPAFSTVCSREEMVPLAERLSGSFRVVTVDWPGFGRSASRKLPQDPALHLAFLAAFMDEVLHNSAAVVAAGHASGYALSLARHRPGIWSRIVLVAPTWRGPLPTMMGGYRTLQDRVRLAIQMPIVGQALYRLNVSRPVISAMYRRHVYADASRITPAFVASKSAIARRSGGRFGSAAFVTGGLDPVRDRQSFAELVSPPTVPTLMVYGADTPIRSRIEMEAIMALPGIRGTRIASGSLGLHEENAALVAEIVLPFLGEATP